MTVDAYAQAYNFYVKKNNFEYYKSEAITVEKLDKILCINSANSFIDFGFHVK